MKSIIPIAFGLAFVAGTACAGGDSAQKFKHLDADASGAIERTELQASHPEAMQQFSQADANANGKLEMAEFAQLEISDPGTSSSTTSTPSESSSDSSSSQSPTSYPPQ